MFRREPRLGTVKNTVPAEVPVHQATQAGNNENDRAFRVSVFSNLRRLDARDLCGAGSQADPIGARSNILERFSCSTPTRSVEGLL